MDGAFPRQGSSTIAAVVLVSLSSRATAQHKRRRDGRVVSQGSTALLAPSCRSRARWVCGVASVDGRSHSPSTDASPRTTCQTSSRGTSLQAEASPVTITGDRLEHEFALERDVLHSSRS